MKKIAAPLSAALLAFTFVMFGTASMAAVVFALAILTSGRRQQHN